jgi:hypothetical protein
MIVHMYAGSMNAKCTMIIHGKVYTKEGRQMLKT